MRSKGCCWRAQKKKEVRDLIAACAGLC